MALILNIETSTTNCSVSLGESGKLLHYIEDNNTKYSHGESLHVFIEELISSAKISNSDLKAIAVSEGPGSYTGLRIGVSAAKGLCFALDIPLISIPTLQILAKQKKVENGFIIPMIDARRMEVYSGIYDYKLNEVRGVEAQVINEGSFNKYLEDDPVYFIGNSNDKVSEVVQSPNANFAKFSLPSSKDMVELSYSKFQENKFEDLAYFEPNYLKKFKAG